MNGVLTRPFTKEEMSDCLKIHLPHLLKNPPRKPIDQAQDEGAEFGGLPPFRAIFGSETAESASNTQADMVRQSDANHAKNIANNFKENIDPIDSTKSRSMDDVLNDFDYDSIFYDDDNA